MSLIFSPLSLSLFDGELLLFLLFLLLRTTTLHYDVLAYLFFNFPLSHFQSISIFTALVRIISVAGPVAGSTKARRAMECGPGHDEREDLLTLKE